MSLAGVGSYRQGATDPWMSSYRSGSVRLQQRVGRLHALRSDCFLRMGGNKVEKALTEAEQAVMIDPGSIAG